MLFVKSDDVDMRDGQNCWKRSRRGVDDILSMRSVEWGMRACLSAILILFFFEKNYFNWTVNAHFL